LLCTFCSSLCNKAITINNYIVERHLDFIAICESWIKLQDNVTIAKLGPPGYSLDLKPRPGSKRGGGVAVIYKDTFKFKTVATLDFSTFEYSDQTLTHLSTHLRTIVLYRPPNTSLALFLEEFSTLLESVAVSPGKLILLGDFNIHVDNSEDTYAKQFLDIVKSFDLVQHVTEPTHKRGHILDLVITRSSDKFANIFIDEPEISDHNSVAFVLDQSKPPLPSKVITYRKTKAIDREKFRDDIKDSFHSLKEYDNVDELADSYNSILNKLLEKHAPVKSKKVTIHPKAPWYTSEINEAKKTKRKAERKWRASRLTVHRQIYISERNKISKLISENKRTYYNKKIEEAPNKQQGLYKCVNSLFNKDTQSKLPDSENDADLCDKIVTFFAEKVKKIEDDLKLLQSEHNNLTDISSPACKGNLLSFDTVTDELVRSVITSSASKSCILDPIPTYLLKECIDVVLPVITRIINLSLESSTVPKCFKTAAVTPLLKKSTLDPNCLKNFRPVSNLPFISKVLEKVVLKQINAHKTDNNLNEKFQSAYRKNHSTESALLRIQNDLLQCMDQRQCCFLVLLDLSAAFDTANHNILIERLA